jgi:tRNA dimethylallyltransferase
VKIHDTKKPIVFLMGPTASGKTALAMDLYQRGIVNQLTNHSSQKRQPSYEIVSVDSAMIYTQMNIGSAKPTMKELSLAPHHLIDFIDPKQSYSASQFCEDVISLINEIHTRGNTPLLTGGTMLYFKALKDGLANLPATDETIREQVNQEVQNKGLEALHKELSLFDPKTAKRLHVNDSQRVTRAVEVYRMTGKPLSQWHEEQQENALNNPFLSIALAPVDRRILHQRIEQRFELMMKQGFLNEVKALFERGDLDLNCPSMRSVGYRQIWLHLLGELSLDESIERAIIATRQLAKRQLTWLRSWPEALNFDPTNENESLKCKIIIEQFVLNHH